MRAASYKGVEGSTRAKALRQDVPGESGEGPVWLE